MRSVSDDLTTRAKIRDAAIRLYGRDGFGKTTIRAVAAEAGVSPGLVMHHFGNTAGLRQACDEHVLTDGPDGKQDPERVRTLLQDYLAEPERYLAALAYISRSLVDNSPAGDAFFDAVLGHTRRMIDAGIADGTVREFEDVHAVAVIMTANSMANFALARHLTRNLDTGDIGAEFARRVSVPIMDLYTNGFYADSRFLDAARSALRDSPAPSASAPREGS